MLTSSRQGAFFVHGGKKFAAAAEGEGQGKPHPADEVFRTAESMGKGWPYFLKMALGIMAWMPLLPSTTWVTRKSTARLQTA